MTDLTEEQEIELEMERQDAGVEQDLHDRVADALDGAEKGAEMETIWAVIEPALATSELARLRVELANEAQTMREIESTCNRLLTSAVELRAERDEHADRLRVTSGAYDRLDAQKRDAEEVRDRWKARAEQAEAAIERVERLRDKWLTWPKDDMHYAAGLMLDTHLSGKAFTSPPRPVSVESPGNDGFRSERPSSAPHSPAEPVSPASTATETRDG